MELSRPLNGLSWTLTTELRGIIFDATALAERAKRALALIGNDEG